MKKFMDKDFLLTTDTAKTLYHDFAADMPIIDYHCHVSPKEIYEDRHFENITQLWLGGDHYKWRLMRSNGIDERYITGDADDKTKFRMFAETLPKAIGNPMYHWCHLELKTYFGYDGVLNGDTVEEVWDLCSEKLKKSDMGVRGIIEKSGVAFIGTTDDPTDSLEWHKKLKADDSMKTTVAPSFRPDKALNIHKREWKSYIEKLEEVSGKSIRTLDDIKSVLTSRMELFASLGCRASDHGLDRAEYTLKTESETEKIFEKALCGNAVTEEEAASYRTYMLLFCAKEYHRLGWVMQLHYNALRNPNTKMYSLLGSDTGFDVIRPGSDIESLAKFLDSLYADGTLPKTILYSLDGSDNAALDALLGAFQGTGTAGKIQHGSAWWFNDHRQGMTEQLVSLANLGLLGNFVGMLTDSRSFLSYTRHEYFRRILCDLLGIWIENGEYPDDVESAGRIVKDICYNNAKRYFDL